MERSNWIALALIGILFGGVIGVNTLKGEVAAEGIISQVEMTELRLSPDGEEVTGGFWTITMVVDQRDTMIFEIAPQDLVLDPSDDPAVEPGTTVEAQSGIVVTVRPAGPPYVVGQVRKRAIVYQDAGETPEQRMWQYYAIAPFGWEGRFVPYEIRIFDWETGTDILPWTTYVVGPSVGSPSWGNNEVVSLPEGLELRNLGEMLNGVTEPVNDWAHIRNNDPDTGEVIQQFVLRSDLLNQYSLNRISSETKLVPSVTLTTVHNEVRSQGIGDYPGFVVDVAGLWDEQYDAPLGGWSYKYPEATFQSNGKQGWLEVTDIGEGFFHVNYDHWEQWFASSVDYTTTFNVDPYWDSYRVIEESHGMDITTIGVQQITDGKVVLDLTGDSDEPIGRARIELYGAVDLWDEFTTLTGIDDFVPLQESEPPTPSPYTGFVRDPTGEVDGVPSWAQIWTPDGAPNLYSATVPPSSFDLVDLETGSYAIWKLPGQGSRATIQLKAPVDLFDMAVFQPPTAGVAEIVEAADINITGGGSAIFTVKVRNIGLTEDTFIPTLDLPYGMSQSPPGAASIDVYSTSGQEHTFSWTVQVGEVEYAGDFSGSIRITPMNNPSGYAEEAVAVHQEPHTGPRPKFGDISVSVQAADIGVVAGATVNVAGQMGVTDASGIVTVRNIQVGSVEVGVTPPLSLLEQGYKSKSTMATIFEGQNSTRVILSKEVGISSTLILIIVVGVIIAIVIVVIVVMVRKKGVKSVPGLKSIQHLVRR